MFDVFKKKNDLLDLTPDGADAKLVPKTSASPAIPTEEPDMSAIQATIANNSVKPAEEEKKEEAPAATGGFAGFFKRTAPSEDSSNLGERISALSEKLFNGFWRQHENSRGIDR